MAWYKISASGNRTYWFWTQRAYSDANARSILGIPGNVAITGSTPVSPAQVPTNIRNLVSGPEGTGYKPPVEAPKAGPSKSPADELIDPIKNLIKMQADDFKKLFVDDPLAVDKGMADAALKSARDKFDPEFTRVLGEFVSDVGITMDSLEDKNKLIDELSGATKGLAGASSREYARAKEAALEGFAARNTYFSGIAERGVGVGEVERKNQLETSATNIGRQAEAFNKAREETIQAGGKLTAQRDLLGQQIIPRYMTFAERYAGQNVAKEALSVLNQFGGSMLSAQSALGKLGVPELNRNVGL